GRVAPSTAGRPAGSLPLANRQPCRASREAPASAGRVPFGTPVRTSRPRPTAPSLAPGDQGNSIGLPAIERAQCESVLDVLFDVTNLGLTFGSELTRTGIFRATDAFVREALGHPELALQFAAMHSYAADVQLARFERATSGLLGDRRISVWENS